MSIEILGSNENKLTLITKNKLKNSMSDIKIEYNLLKDKYLTKVNSDIIDKKCYNHFINQLIKLFNPKSKNIEDFIEYINNTNSNSDLYKHVKNSVANYNVLSKLNNAVDKIKNKLGEKYSMEYKKESHNKLYKDIKFILLIADADKTNVTKCRTNLIKEITEELTNLKNKTIQIKKLNILNNNKKIKYNRKYTNAFIEDLIDALDNIIIINKTIKKYIIEIDEIINLLTDKLYKLHYFI